MTDETPTAVEELRTFATFDSLGGKVSKRVEVLPTEPRPSDDGRYDGLVAVVGEHPLGALDERPHGHATLARGVPSVGWVDPADLRDWYRPDRVVVPLVEANVAGLEPGLFADTRTRGRVRITDREGHLGPDGRPAFRALVGPPAEPRLDAPLPREEVVRIVSVSPDAVTDAGAAGVAVVTMPVAPVLAPGVYPDRAADRVGLPPAPSRGAVRVRAFSVSGGERHEIERLDEQANTMWIAAPDGQVVPVAVNAVEPDLVRYVAEPI